MRPLTEEETRIFFEKIMLYIGQNIKYLINRKDEDYCFRLHGNRVYYLAERIALKAVNFGMKNLVSLGTCFGKFSKSLKFRLHITCLDYLGKYAIYKVWVKPSAELSFLYGSHVLGNGLGRITEDTVQYQRVVVYNMNDIPIGFGVASKSTYQCRNVGPTEIVCFHQADIGEYLRDEATLL